MPPVNSKVKKNGAEYEVNITSFAYTELSQAQLTMFIFICNFFINFVLLFDVVT